MSGQTEDGGKIDQAASDLRASLEREESRVAVMMELGRSLTAVADQDALLSLVVGRVSDLMDADRSTIFLVDREHGEIWSKVAQGDDVEEIRLPLGRGISGWVAEHGRSINIKDAYIDERFDKNIDKITGYKTLSLLCVPLRGKRGDILGVIQSLNKRGGHFTVEDERLLEAICSQVSVAVENAQLVLGLLAKNIELQEAQQQLARKVEELDVLFGIEKEISAATHIDGMLERLLHRAVELVECEAGSVVLLSPDSQDLIFASAVGTRAEAVRHLRLRRGLGVAGWVAEHGRSALVNDPGGDERHLKNIEEDLDFPVRNMLAVPLGAEGDVLGAFELLNKHDGLFGPDDEKLATLIAGQVHSAVLNWQRREEHEKEERLSSIGQMLSGVIHDFRTPMTIISGYVQLMATEAESLRRREQSNIILRQFDFINDMIRELLAFARGESSLLMHKVYTDRLLDEMKELLTRELDISGVKLEIEDRYHGALRVDENKLRRLLVNIARNARQAMPAGGMFTISVEGAGDSVIFEFADTGPGIPAEIRGNLFESFVSSGKEDGTGLGLAIVKKIVDEHGGRIEVLDRPGGGTVFRVGLPTRLES
ncbi:MAG TPA: GAF domain-containing protein [Myxococcota bacterium]|nr:GAF domain-containing protein [Myxococcota bacterium]